jgi:hypothetical protein
MDVATLAPLSEACRLCSHRHCELFTCGMSVHAPLGRHHRMFGHKLRQLNGSVCAELMRSTQWKTTQLAPLVYSRVILECQAPTTC